jgi:hypothetical protein
VAKFILIKTASNDTYINPDHVVCIEAVGTGCRITMTDGRDFTTPEDKDSVAMRLSDRQGASSPQNRAQMPMSVTA